MVWYYWSGIKGFSDESTISCWNLSWVSIKGQLTTLKDDGLESIEVEEFKDDVEIFKSFIKTMGPDIGQDDVKIPQFKELNNQIEFKQKLI